MRTFRLLGLTCLVVVACGGGQAPAAGPVEGDAKARPQLTAEACEASGGVVVGDIGDGAIHKPEYRCPSGAAPSGGIQPAAGGPVAIEGAVCCPKA